MLRHMLFMLEIRSFIINRKNRYTKTLVDPDPKSRLFIFVNEKYYSNNLYNNLY